jgi:hypothetical protein
MNTTFLDHDREPSNGSFSFRRGARCGARRRAERGRRAPRRSSALHPQSHGAAQRRALLSILLGDDDQRRARFARQPGEPHRDRAAERGRGIDDDERERAAAQQHVGAPGGTRGIGGTDHPHALVLAEMCPVARREGACRVDVGHPTRALHSLFDDAAKQCGLAAAACTDDLREPAAREPTPLQRAVELRQSRREPGNVRGRGRKERAERGGGGERHETAVWVDAAALPVQHGGGTKLPRKETESKKETFPGRLLPALG